MKKQAKMPSKGEKIPKELFDLVVHRLSSYGYEVKENDKFNLMFSIEKVYSHIFIVCNIREIPRPLAAIFAERVCGEFLQNLLDTLGLAEFLKSFKNEEADKETDEEEGLEENLDNPEENPEDLDKENLDNQEEYLKISSVKIGDTTISYDTQAVNPLESVENFLENLKNFGEGELLCFRRLRW